MIYSNPKKYVPGFGTHIKKFDQYYENNIKLDCIECDISIYNIIKYFQLCMENNPNIIDSLFVPCNCITYSSYIGDLIRENRKIFLHKGALAKFKGYALSQIHKMKYKNPEGKRKELINKFGYDIKYGYNCIRLLDEVEQILTEHDLCLNKNIEKLKSIRNGEWSIEQIEKYIKQKECELELLFIKSDLRQLPDERHIRQLLIDCLEIWFEKEPGPIDKFIIELQGLINKYKLEEN